MKKFLILILAMSAIAVGCSDTRTNNQRTVDSTLLSFQDFDLETVVALVKDNKVKDAKALEAFINSDKGINNVDIDKDGKIDYVRVVESKDGGTIVLDMRAVPSGGGEEVTVASLDFKQTTSDQVTVQGGYPSYVGGYNNHYYSYNTSRNGMSMGEAMFLMWLLTPARPMYIQPMPMYAPRPVYSRSALTTTRTTTRTQTKVSPIKTTTKPSGFAIKSAQKTQSRLKTMGSSSFTKRDPNKAKSKATGFGAKGTPKSASPARTQKKSSSGWGRSSGSSRSRSWGGSRSFGGGRRRSSARYKEDIQDFHVGMEAIQKMNAVNWKWRNNSDQPTVGFVAEDMAKIFPEAVFRNDSGEIEGIDYSMIVVPLVNSMQQMQEEINQLKQRQ